MKHSTESQPIELPSEVLKREQTRHRIALESVTHLLRHIGEDPDRDGLRETPARVVKALEETTRGYRENPKTILSKTFSQEEESGYAKYNGIVVLRDIEFCSQCEHHMLPFVGTAHIAYLPGEDGRIVGISKLARLVDCFARRLQVQERLTAQIADAIETHLGASGVLVKVEAQHYCMRMRGVGKQHSSMVTGAVRGDFARSHTTRREAWELLRGAQS